MVSLFRSKVFVLVGSFLALSLWSNPALGVGRGQVRRLPTPPRVQPLPAARSSMMTPNILPRTRSLVSPFCALIPADFRPHCFLTRLWQTPASAECLPSLLGPTGSLR